MTNNKKYIYNLLLFQTVLEKSKNSIMCGVGLKSINTKHNVARQIPVTYPE